MTRNQLGRTREVEGETWIFRFANGLVVHTDPFMKADSQRILPIGGPQDTISNLLVCNPDMVRGKRVFDPFAGSGVLGLMALRLGAAHVDFLDVTSRAVEFQRANAARNGFSPQSYGICQESIERFEAEQPYDLVLANPPFVPTPPGIDGTLTSAAGPEGNALVDVLLQKLERLLRPEGEALFYVMQLVAKDGPLVVRTIADTLTERTVELTPTQVEPIALDDYSAAYRKSFPAREQEITSWQAGLTAQHGALGVQQYVVHVGARRPGPTRWLMADNLMSKYGMLPYPAHANRDLALCRVLENVIAPQR